MYIQVKNIEEMEHLFHLNDDDVIYCEEEEKLFIWDSNEGFIEKNEAKMNGSFNVTYRDLLITAIKDNEPINILDNEIYCQMMAWYDLHKSEMLLLYGKEMGYFTFLKSGISNENLFNIVNECLSNIGEIIYIEPDFIGMPHIIFWLKLPDEKITEVYLFDATPLVVEFGGI